jgi:hypothetical protein
MRSVENEEGRCGGGWEEKAEVEEGGEEKAEEDDNEEKTEDARPLAEQIDYLKL